MCEHTYVRTVQTSWDSSCHARTQYVYCSVTYLRTYSLILIYQRTYLHTPTFLDGLWCEYRKKNANGTVVEGYQLCNHDVPFTQGSNPHIKGCYGSYNINSMGGVETYEQFCAAGFFGICNSSSCNIPLSADSRLVYTTFLYCCCNSSGCNEDEPVLHPHHPIYPGNVTHVDHGG